MTKSVYSFEDVSLPEAYNPKASKVEQEKYRACIESIKDKLFLLEAQEFAVYVQEFFKKNPDVLSLTFSEGHEYSDEGLDQPIGVEVEFLGYELVDSYYGSYEKLDGGEDDNSEALYEKAQEIISEFVNNFYDFLQANHGNIPTLSADSLEKDIKEMLGEDNYLKWQSVLEKNHLENKVKPSIKIDGMSSKI